MKRSVQIISLIVILVAGIVGVAYMYSNVPITYDGTKTDVYALMNDPDGYTLGDEDGAASVIVKENLAETQAMNDVSSIVFDFRGYDTMGEAFILVIAVTGTAVILRKGSKRKEADGK